MEPEATLTNQIPLAPQRGHQTSLAVMIPASIVDVQKDRRSRRHPLHLLRVNLMMMMMRTMMAVTNLKSCDVG